MTEHEATPRSRRAILGAALGAGVATIASALGRPSPISAADGEAVVVGGEYTATSVTRFDTAATGAVALSGESDAGIGVLGTSISSTALYGQSSSGRGVYGISVSNHGLFGYSTSGTAIYGDSTSNVAVHGLSNQSNGILGVSNASDNVAILGVSQGSNAGVQGFSGPLGSQPAGPASTGVYGYAAQSPAARGVIGESPAGQGVRGLTETGIGVRGFADSGVAASFETATGMALVTKGRVRFQQIAGKATVQSGTNSITVTPGVDLTSGTSVLATLNGNPGAGTYIHRVAIETTTNSFTIFLTANSTATISVAWFVLDQ